MVGRKCRNNAIYRLLRNQTDVINVHRGTYS
jgi:hypothetical protein